MNQKECRKLQCEITKLYQEAIKITINNLLGRPKGQLISKGFWGSSIPSKKQTNKFNFTSGRLVFVLFFGGNRRPQKTISKLTDLYQHYVYF